MIGKVTVAYNFFKKTGERLKRSFVTFSSSSSLYIISYITLYIHFILYLIKFTWVGNN